MFLMVKMQLFIVERLLNSNYFKDLYYVQSTIIINKKHNIKMKYNITIILLLLINLSVFSQKIVITEMNADCSGAINISGYNHFTASAPVSAGMVNEISSFKGDVYYFEKEHYTVWYYFIPTQEALLSFVITPDKATDDYDFILFECSNDNCCDNINSKRTKPIRTNISRTKVLADGITGLNSMASTSFVHEGKGDNFSTSVIVKKDKKYILVLDNVYGGKDGHSISLNFENINKEDIKERKPMLNLNIVDKKTNTLIEANIKIIHFDENHNADTIISESSSSLFIPLDIEDFYEIRISKNDYLFEEVSIRAHNDDSLISKTIALTKASKGTSFELNNLYFVGGSAQFTGQYKKILMNLLRIMKANPTLRIKIIGHVNRPNGSYRHKSEEYYNKLSIDRAKAVYDYLIKRGIAENRLESVGVGYSEMVYPNATKSDEMQINRRVEIIVQDF